jgi:hypothetical protein
MVMGNIEKVLKLRAHSGFSIGPSEILHLLRSCEAGKIAFIENDFGVCIGYLAWASVNRYSIENINRYCVFPRYEYEFSEGRIPLILDVFISPKDRQEGICKLRGIVKKWRLFSFYRKSKLKMYIKRKGIFFLLNLPTALLSQV